MTQPWERNEVEVKFCVLERRKRHDIRRIVYRLVCSSDESMVQYRFARLVSGEIVDAVALRGTQERKKQYHCLGCGEELIAKVEGEKMRPHFAHRAGTTCSKETYLHKAGKELFAETFERCLADGTPFEIVLQHPIVCRRFEEYLGSPCDRRSYEVKSHDLTLIFDSVEIEKRDGDFVPDLLLKNTKKPSRRMYVEIAVTHFLSEMKEMSNEKILEIPVANEDDLDVIRNVKLTHYNCRFINLIPESQRLVDSDCVCSTRRAYAFFVFKNGKCCLDSSTITALTSKHQRLADSIDYFRLLFPKNCVNDDFLPFAGDVFRSAVEQAIKDGVSLKNCYLCKYQGNNFTGPAEHPVFCRCFRNTCNSNEAVHCTAFRRRIHS